MPPPVKKETWAPAMATECMVPIKQRRQLQTSRPVRNRTGTHARPANRNSATRGARAGMPLGPLAGAGTTSPGHGKPTAVRGRGEWGGSDNATEFVLASGDY